MYLQVLPQLQDWLHAIPISLRHLLSSYLLSQKPTGVFFTTTLHLPVVLTDIYKCDGCCMVMNKILYSNAGFNVSHNTYNFTVTVVGITETGPGERSPVISLSLSLNLSEFLVHSCTQSLVCKYDTHARSDINIKLHGNYYGYSYRNELLLDIDPNNCRSTL